MKPQTNIYIALTAAAIVIIAAFAVAEWSSHKISKLERAVEETRQTADGIRRSSEEKEKQAAEYKQKIDYLERQLADIQTLARKQDEKLKAITDNTRNSRRDVDSARRVRTIDTTTAELCKKLAEVGHGCG